jgi:hypothetical protein
MIDHITGKATLKTIEILVGTKGETTVTTKGFSGSACRGASQFLEVALGQRARESLTGEFYQAAAVQQRQEQRT